MIITGYQGIGKSTLASKSDRIIDLESGCFWKTDEFVSHDEHHPGYMLEKVEKTRPKDWYVYYCQMAQHLSQQGYIVFVSCHEEVREYLMRHNEEPFYAIFPDEKLKEDWLKRLKDRYDESKLDKDLRAYQHAEKSYSSDIHKLWNECQYNVEYYKDVEIIKNINYDLADLVNSLIRNQSLQAIESHEGNQPSSSDYDSENEDGMGCEEEDELSEMNEI